MYTTSLKSLANTVNSRDFIPETRSKLLTHAFSNKYWTQNFHAGRFSDFSLKSAFGTAVEVDSLRVEENSGRDGELRFFFSSAACLSASVGDKNVLQVIWVGRAGH